MVERAGAGRSTSVSVSPLTIRNVDGRPARGSGERALRAAGRSEHRHFPRVADAHAEIALPSPRRRRQRLRQMMQVEHDVGDAAARSQRRMRSDERHAGHRQRGLGADERQRTKTGGEAGCQDECWDHSSANIMSAPVNPSRSSSLQEQAAIRVEDEVGLASARARAP